MFHDVGNIGVPDRILLKRGSLKADEWRCLHQHTTIGEQLLERRAAARRRGPAGRALAPRALGRHRVSRTASRGHEIPLGARIFSVADALDAMTDRRPYRRPLRWEAALARIRKERRHAVRPGRRRRAARLRARPDRDPQPLRRVSRRPSSRPKPPARSPAPARLIPRRLRARPARATRPPAPTLSGWHGGSCSGSAVFVVAVLALSAAAPATPRRCRRRRSRWRRSRGSRRPGGSTPADAARYRAGDHPRRRADPRVSRPRGRRRCARSSRRRPRSRPS